MLFFNNNLLDYFTIITKQKQNSKVASKKQINKITANRANITADSNGQKLCKCVLRCQPFQIELGR